MLKGRPTMREVQNGCIMDAPPGRTATLMANHGILIGTCPVFELLLQNTKELRFPCKLQSCKP
eukprot:11769861-Alexandrium_andersonii.AAC.1